MSGMAGRINSCKGGIKMLLGIHNLAFHVSDGFAVHYCQIDPGYILRRCAHIACNSRIIHAGFVCKASRKN